jgi:putative oxidoreductase
MNIGLLILRLVVGLTMAAHGSQKLLGWFGGPGPAGTSGMMESLGLRPGRLHATLAGAAELSAGVLLVLGLLTPLAAAMVIGVMTVAVGTIHYSKGFFMQNGGFEYNLVLAAAALCLAFAGPGALSLDHAFGIAWAGGSWGTSALIVGLAAGGIALLLRNPGTARAPAH